MITIKRPPVVREDGTIAIQLTKGYVAVIDACDAHLAEFNWSAMTTAQNNTYAFHRGRLLHRMVMGVETFGHEVEVDHKNGDTLDCRRANLRCVSPTVNRRNRGAQSNNKSGFVGVHYSTHDKRWRAGIEGVHLGSFMTAGEANEARLKAERVFWGIEPQREGAHK